ncbi:MULTISPECIES: class I adenylate-forming enzyme family protein [Nocardia]|uniref:class I adenylate-forming enzyme family protein n=1 Tax=Nocardia TaxID=1817 RepID=UPI0007E94A9C|nr:MULTISPECIES: class I adenylate-forming enzyme family protein [Nocardia]MBF6275736.1 acyl--CoA ligase [Nocardia nova]OBA40716.1 fatty acid--CoA ligase [Nocardia sp. 852002-51101_SCH5132738]OBB49968.1 fatty acid--CoA ligase [Nocardia sp. 852002-51244_SCH5132740]OBF84650.1 fatty acid--CoA ligase [Mycobacterium sp. 852002-51759_SCH5129042]
MTTTSMPDIAAVMRELAGPGGRFELVEEEVLGARMPVLRHRRRAVAELLADSVRFGDRDYLVTEDRRVSYREHAAAAAALAAALREEYGVGRGDRVAILAANTVEWVITFWAAQSLGAIAVGLNGWWVPREIEYGLALTEPAVVVVDAKRAKLLADIDTAAAVVTMDEDLPRLIAAHAGAEPTVPDVAEDDPAVILFTSGTSGKPKAALHSQRNLLAVTGYFEYTDALAAAFTGKTLEPGAPLDLRCLLTSPLFHIASLHNLVVPRLATGSAVIMPQGGFDADRILRLIEKERVTNWGAVPTMASRLLEHGDIGRYDTSSLTAFALASAPSSPAFKQRLREEVPFAADALVDSYGLTECSTAVAVATPADLAESPGTLGRPIISVALEIRDADGTPVPEGVEGEVYVRSPFVMLGYWRNPEATAAAIDAERWLRTGDFGVMEQGRLRLTGRRSDLILRGGENIYPVEIEQCLDEHPDVVECAVVGEPHPDLGQQVAAVVVLTEGSTASEADLREFARERLAYFKVPERWRITSDPLPRNITGKLIRSGITV